MGGADFFHARAVAVRRTADSSSERGKILASRSRREVMKRALSSGAMLRKENTEAQAMAERKMTRAAMMGRRPTMKPRIPHMSESGGTAMPKRRTPSRDAAALGSRVFQSLRAV
jgi:hypothetical protein